MNSVKDYVYISDTKVDLLYEQIATSDVAKTGAEYGIDIKVLKWVGKRETQRVITRMTKLNRVIEFLLRSEKMGTIHEPKQYFYGSLVMRWGILEKNREPIMVLFTGETTKQTIVLGGSAKHVIGGAPAGEVGSSSVYPSMVSGFWKFGDKDLDPIKEYAEEMRDDEILHAVDFAVRTFKAPKQHLEFVATHHLSGRCDRATLVLGTPFYVATAG